jgi:endo-1,4-beta-xylanase
MLTLKDAFKDHFYLGAVLNENQIYRLDADSIDILKKHFNSITAENVMKWSELHNEPGNYNFESADRFVALGEENNMFIVGHTLIWHNQVPSWVFLDESQNLISRVKLLQRMRDHIYTVISHYKGRVNEWEVVNEAIADDGNMRKSSWLEIIGDDYVQKAFEFAHEADPKALLYYNDYSLCVPAKRNSAIRLIKNLQSKGIKIDGIGMQGHLILDFPGKREDIENSITAFSELGVKIMITELDISVLPFPDKHMGADISLNFEYQEKLNPYPGGLPDSIQEKLANRYYELFKIFHAHKDKISRVTIWGIYDAQSWLNNWPIKGRTDYPLLFDRNYQPKQAFYAVMKSIKD